MKILAVSHHRLGDLMMHAHVLKELKAQTGATLHLFTHSFFQSVAFLFPYLDKVWIFQREACQYAVGEDHFNKSWPYFHIQKLLEELNQQNFDLIIDLSQTDESSRWMTFLQAKKKVGVCYQSNLQGKAFCSDNSYIQYLHRHARSNIHFIDLFKLALNIDLTPLPEPSSVGERQKLILLQTSSSDEKKNWPLSRWKMLIEKVSNELPDYQIKLIGNQNEVQLLNQYFQSLPTQACIVPTTIPETYSLLKTASLIVTLDTAIKHLATWTQTPIIEIALGSSDPAETGAYQKGSVIIQSTAPCRPCSHSQDCHQTKYLCHDTIEPEVVWNLIANQLKPEIGSPSEDIPNGHGYRVGSVSQDHDLKWQVIPIHQSREVPNAGRNQSSIDQHCQTP